MNNKTVLVVEDERALVEAIKMKLEKKGFSVVTGRSVKQAFSYLNDGVKIDAIWLDHYLLGKESGLDLVARIKEAKSKYRQIPIFVVSNTATPNKVQSYLRLGVNKYFTKADNKLEDIICAITDFLTKNSE